MKTVYTVFLIFICSFFLSCAYSQLIDESVSLLPLENNLVHVKLKLEVNGNSYRQFLPVHILKILTFVKSLKINIRRGIYKNSFNNKYLNSYPFGFTLVTELKENIILPLEKLDIEDNRDSRDNRGSYKNRKNQDSFDMQLGTNQNISNKKLSNNNSSNNSNNNSNNNNSDNNIGSDNNNNDNNNKKSNKKKYSDFTEEEIYILTILLNDIWDITGVESNLLNINNFVKHGKQIFAFLSERQSCSDSLTLLKKLYPCKDFGGLFNIIDPQDFISRSFSNIGFELNDTEDVNDLDHIIHNHKKSFTLYMDYITEHDHKKNIRVLDLLNVKYKTNECPLITRTALFIKRKKENGVVGTVKEIYKNLDVLYEIVNFSTLPNTFYGANEEFANVNVFKQEKNSMITAHIRKKQSSLLYVFQNENETKKSDFVYIDKLPYFLSPLLHTLMIQGRKLIPSPNNYSLETKLNNKIQKEDPFSLSDDYICDFTYFGYDALTKFQLTFQNFEPNNTVTPVGINITTTYTTTTTTTTTNNNNNNNNNSNNNIYSNSHYLHFKYILPPQCEILIRFEVVKIQIRTFELPFDYDRGLLLSSGIFLEKNNRDPLDKHKIQQNNQQEEKDTYVITYTPPLVVDIPMPDTSMPYNVMAVSTCIIMVFFGFIFKITAKEEKTYV